MICMIGFELDSICAFDSILFIFRCVFYSYSLFTIGLYVHLFTRKFLFSRLIPFIKKSWKSFRLESSFVLLFKNAFSVLFVFDPLQIQLLFHQTFNFCLKLCKCTKFDNTKYHPESSFFSPFRFKKG